METPPIPATTEEVKQALLITSLIFFVLDIEEVEVNDGDFNK